jgi:hypothetical protein
MNETKANTKIGDVTSPEAKKSLLALTCVARIDVEEGRA